MQNIIRNSMATAVVIIAALFCMVTLPTVTYAAVGDGGKSQACQAIGSNEDCSTGSGKDKKLPEENIQNVIKTVINIMSAIGGIIAVIMIIIGGFKFMTAAGDSTKAASARNTIIFALAGLVVVAFAQVIVQFVLQRTT